MRGQSALARVARRELPPAIAERWISLLRPSFFLRAADKDELAIGQLGGNPLLPDGMAWPQHWDGRGPLTFIADIDCGQLPSGTLGMPRTGMLSFFAWDEEAPGYLEATQVVYTPTGSPVTEREPPSGARRYNLVELTGGLHATGPDLTSPVLTEAVEDKDRAWLDDWSNHDARDAFNQAWCDLMPTPDHRIGGHARPVQDSVETGLAHDRLGLRCDDPGLNREALRWNLLAQFDSDHWARMMWGDCGTIYWLIQPADLAARRFEAAAFTWQCH